MWEEHPFALTPISFFALAYDCRPLSKGDSFPSLTSSYLLPNTHALCHEDVFAKIAMGWSEEGLGWMMRVDQPFTRALFPQLQQGDSVELMIDTRDVKSAGFNTRFCHHFYFLPEPVDGQQAGEITHFRTEDRHPLCDPHLLQCRVQKGKNDYNMKIFIPAECLHGYDPKQFNRIGFTYQINRAGGPSQHFAAASQDYQIEQQPSLWSSIQLIK